MKQVNGLVRFSLWIHVTDAHRRDAYEVRHVGFFSKRVARCIVDSFDIRGLAFHSDVSGQIGRVHLVTAVMIGEDGQSEGDILARSECYGAPRHV